MQYDISVIHVYIEHDKDCHSLAALFTNQHQSIVDAAEQAENYAEHVSHIAGDKLRVAISELDGVILYY